MRNPVRDIQRLVAALRRLGPFIPFTRRRIAAVAGTMALTTVLEVAGVGLLAQLLNIVLGTTSSGSRMVRLAGRWAPQASPVDLSIIFAAVIVVVIAVKNASSYVNTTLMARIERESVVNLRRTLFARLQRAPLEVFEQHSSAALSNLFVEETRRAMDCMTVLFGMVQTAATAGLFFVALIWISAPLAVATLAAGILAAALVSRLYRFFGRLGRELTDANMRLMRAAGEAFNGVRVVRAVHAQEAMAGRFGAASAAQARTDERFRRGTAVLLPVVETGSIAAALVLLIGSFALLVAPGHMSQAKLTAFGLVLLRLVPLVNRYSGTQAHLLYLAGSLREIGRWLDTPGFPERPFGTARLDTIRIGISVRGLSYRYLPAKHALHEVSFDIPAGSTVALVGRSGSGKSTLATLLMRMREPSDGTVLVDGADFWTFSPESWHGGVALVEQEPFLFNDTLGANVAFGFEGASPEEIEFALHVAHLDDFLDSLPDRLETPIGERGVMLSGGQRQRLSIARAIVRNPRFLILDEATSNLDTVSEELVQAALEAATRGRTTLVIAHRLSTVRRADRIVVLADGRVAETGTWDELVARGGVFAELVQKGFDAGR
ncbi:MAG: ABC transporter ATP-binding protein [Gemmatimonadota bacterium]|nr:ABC transporter ATP-binding protein [Gemmatimonadota bacterium]